MTQVSDEYSETVIIQDEVEILTALPDEPAVEVGLLAEPTAQTVEVITDAEMFGIAMADPSPPAPATVVFTLLTLKVAVGGVKGIWTTDAPLTTIIAYRPDGDPDWISNAEIPGLRDYHQATIIATFAEETTYELQLSGNDIDGVPHLSSTYHFHIDSVTHEVEMGVA